MSGDPRTGGIDPACGCCDGVQASTPQGVFNRAGLPAVAYRIGTQPDFAASLVAGLTDAGRPRLARLLTREGSDFTLGLIDAFACAADVITFYQERTAQENWLRTAVERDLHGECSIAVAGSCTRRFPRLPRRGTNAKARLSPGRETP